MMINIKNDYNWPGKERNEFVNSCTSCLVDNEVIKHITGGIPPQ